MRFAWARASVCVVLTAWSAAGVAQNKSVQAKPMPAKPAADAQERKQQFPLDAIQLSMLIKSAVMALQHANQTGNYSVLRDLGTPVFRERFDQARLTSIFAGLRARGINLSPVLMIAPNLLKPPEFTPQGQLHLVGYFPTQPLQIQYEMLFLQIDGIWRIEGLSVAAEPAQATASTSLPAPKMAEGETAAANRTAAATSAKGPGAMWEASTTKEPSQR